MQESERDQSHLPRHARLGLKHHRVARYAMVLYMAYPIVDYALRLPHIHPIGVIWDVVVLLILAVVALRRWLAGEKPKLFLWQKFAGWYILFCFAMMFSNIGQPILAVQGLRDDIYYMLYTFLMPFVVDEEDVPKLLHVLASTAVLIGANGIYQYVTKAPVPQAFNDVNEHVRTRVFSVLQSPNEMGAFTAMTSPLLISLAIRETNRWRKMFYILGAVFCLASLLFSYTRGAWLAFALSLLITALIFERRLLLILLVVGVVAFFLPSIHHRFADLFSPVYFLKSAEAGRIARWLTAFDHMAANPLFGAGLGHYGGQVAATYRGGIYSDNYYAKTLGESGLVGLVLFAGMQLSLLYELYKKVAKAAWGRDKFLAIGGFAGILAVVIHNFTENVWEYNPMTALYFAFSTLLLIWGYGRFGKEVQDGQNIEA
ncbi:MULTISPECIES: O-antigen ligase [Alicyclobacillus]|nr:MULTISPECIES: O-antigen ligase family protein [Alicyclobacillus]